MANFRQDARRRKPEDGKLNTLRHEELIITAEKEDTQAWYRKGQSNNTQRVEPFL